MDKTTLRQFQFYYNQTKQRPSLPSLCHPSASREETVESLESNSAVFAGRPLHDGHQKQPGEMRRGSCPSYLPPLPHLNISCQLRQRVLQSQILNTMGTAKPLSDLLVQEQDNLYWKGQQQRAVNSKVTVYLTKILDHP